MQLPFDTSSKSGILNTIGAACVIIGGLMRINHITGANILLIIGAIVFVIGFLLPFFGKKQRQWIDYVLLTGSIFLILFVLSRTLLRNELYAYQLIFAGGALLTAPFYVIHQMRGDPSLSRILFIAGLTGIAIGTVFKIQHWTGATILLGSGLGLTALSYIVDMFQKPEDVAPDELLDDDFVDFDENGLNDE